MVTMLCLTFSFFLTEIVFGYVTNSLALIGDSYHMLSDVMALIVGLTSLRVDRQCCTVGVDSVADWRAVTFV